LALKRCSFRTIAGWATELIVIFLFGLSIVVFLMFLGVDTREEAALRGLAKLPLGCEAGFYQGGAYICWFTIREHPVWFALSLLGLVASAIVVARLHKSG
jgi:hypothetical protein